MSLNNRRIAVVIPSFKVKKQILSVIDKMPEFVDQIFVVDDCCPERTGAYVIENCKDSRVTLLYNQVNKGVGGAVCRGYEEAKNLNFDVIVKVDGDGQMDPRLIKSLIEPILAGEADYVKGSRFYKLSSLEKMPPLRLFGNTALSFINKVVTGYWEIMDPTNGFTAISMTALSELPLKKISARYYFESDMLFRLSLCRARVVDYPMNAHYGEEVSNLSITKVLFDFPPRYFKRFIKRIFYLYFLRDFNFGSLSLIVGTMFLSLGLLIGSTKYLHYAIMTNTPAPTGMVVIPAMLIILGSQFLISFFQHDILSSPKQSLDSKRLNYYENEQ